MKASLLYGQGSLGDLIITALSRYSNRIAFIDGDREITYGAASEDISRVMQALRELGLEKGDTVVQIARNSPEQWFLMAAIYLLGLRSVTLHPLGSVEDHAFCINHSDAKLVIVDNHFAERIEPLRKLSTCACQWMTHGEGTEYAAFSSLSGKYFPQRLKNFAEAEDIIRLAYTGGTTGKPKGVMLSARALLTNAMIALADKEWPKAPRFLCPAPISHGGGANIIPTLYRGGTFIMLPSFDRDTVLNAITRHGASIVYLVPTMIYALLNYPRTKQCDLSSLRLIMYGASSMPASRIREAMSVFGPVLCQAYGQTEAPNSITVLTPSDHQTEDSERLRSCGMPCPGIQVQILNEDCQPIEDGVVGEICVRGPLVMSGYWKEPQLTAVAFSNGWLHTGDLAYRDEAGYFYIVDRKKDVVISGGFNIYPREIEDVISTHPAVLSVAVFGMADEKWGEAVTAAIVLRQDAAPCEDEILSLVRQKKGPIHVPKSIKFVNSIPLTSLGKPDKKALRQQYQSM